MSRRLSVGKNHRRRRSKTPRQHRNHDKFFAEVRHPTLNGGGGAGAGAGDIPKMERCGTICEK